MEDAGKFWDKMATRYYKQPIADEASYQKKLSLSGEYLEPNHQCLEIACGTGSTAIIHSTQVEHIHAIDISKNMIEIANQQAKDQNINNVTFEATTLDQLNIEPNSLDVVFSMSILHLIDNYQKVIKQIHDLLKPGGIFISSTICIGDQTKLLKYIAPIGAKLGLMPSLNRFTNNELVAQITQNQFTILENWQPNKKKALFLIAKK